ncbi:MAG: hypothetical protein ACJAZX_000114 [Rickettsiales bacterium]|jgi:hypothetical protein
MKIIYILTAFFLFSTQGECSEILFSKASYENGQFFIQLSSVVKATPKEVFKILTDYKHLSRISSKIIESKIIQKNADGLIVQTIAEGCVWFFCKKIINTQKITINKTELWKNIQSFTIPSMSNLKFGKMNWIISQNKEGANIEYSAQIEPDFFVPPAIGTFFMKRAMLKESKSFADNVEKLAIANASLKSPL